MMKEIKEFRRWLGKVRGGQTDPLTFQHLSLAMENYRDYLNGVLDPLTLQQRWTLGRKIYHDEADSLISEAWTLAQAAEKEGLIPRWLMLDVGYLMESISFVCIHPVADYPEPLPQEARV